MAERFYVAAFRHLKTAGVLEKEGCVDDAGYHYGLAGEMAVKWALVKAGIKVIPDPGIKVIPDLRKHFGGSLQRAVADSKEIMGVLKAGRLGGQLADDLNADTFKSRFYLWSINIRYADSCHPVDNDKLVAWKADAVALVNGVL